MSNSMFDPDAFLSEETKGSNSTSLIPLPEKEVPGVVTKVEARTFGEYAVLDVHWEVDDVECSEMRGGKAPTVRQTIFLDISETGGLDMSEGKNIGLGRLRKAVGQNGKGAWSPTQLEGETALIKITQTPNKEDPSIVYNNVGGVTALG